MILAELVINDYKQFAGTHRFTPSPDGVVAVIGPNGAGKTTLFEAIEWCLYQPREIAASEVPPRGRSAKPSVQITLEDPETHERFVIVRTLNRSGVADAEIYREESPESRIVKGSRPTTDYVERSLIGLGHRAFVSTFFTRQKELSFFGDLRDTDRRREVGRLLGMETIRDAQKLIATDRTAARNRADALRSQHEEQTRDRDFAAEAAAATEHVEAELERETISADALVSADHALHAARTALEAMRVSELRVNELLAVRGDLTGQKRAAEVQIESAKTQLNRITENERLRPETFQLSEQRDPLRVAVSEHELQRERQQRVRQIERELAQSEESRGSTIQRLSKIVQQRVCAEAHDWQWCAADEGDPLDAIARLTLVAEAIDLAVAERRLRDLERFAAVVADLASKRPMLEKYRARLTEIEVVIARVTADDPEARLRVLAVERDDTIKIISGGQARESPIARDVTELEAAVVKLRHPAGERTCPTCGQPLEDGVLAVAVATLQRRIDELTQERTSIRGRSSSASARLKEIDGLLADAQSRAQQAAESREKLADGRGKTSELEALLGTLDQEQMELREKLGELASAGVPEVEAQRERTAALREIRGSLSALATFRDALERLASERDRLDTERASLGEVTYDAKAYERARGELSAAETAAARLAEIDRVIESRPKLEGTLAETAIELAAIEAALAENATARDAVGFDPAALEGARRTESEAVKAEQDARSEHFRAQAALARAQQDRDRLTKEHASLERLLVRAMDAMRESDQLDRMYTEFNVFEQFVAERLAPQLSDFASELVGQITEGKYSQIELDSNYGLHIFDGPDERFPIEEFSGGERDVIALSARLALSRLIGSQAARPPSFMVMDEVFGSLDVNRRSALLEMLASQAGTSSAFQQLFVISHVDDVRMSPIFNEIWRVAEDGDGISRLENLSLSGRMEEG